MKAYAKINLFLRICGKLGNGYHRLITFMQAIELADDIEISFDYDREFGISVSCDGALDIDEEQNLCYLAAKEFYSKLILESGKALPFTSISVTKNIPSQAGLGGGSSDAAVVLMSLQKEFGNPFSKKELNRMASNLGADVAFFLYGDAAICKGTGDIVEPAKSFSRIPMLVIKPSVGVSTPLCFKEVDKYGLDESILPREYFKFDELISGAPEDSIERAKALKEFFVNDLQKPAVCMVEEISQLIKGLDEQGSFFSAMSGSGSAVFGLFENEQAQKQAYDSLKKNHRLAECDIYLTYTR